MKHFSYEGEKRIKEVFFKEPEPFNKYSDKEILSYALGATLYMPALRENIANEVIEHKFPELMSMVIDLEDAVGDSQLFEAEMLAVEHVRKIYGAVEGQQLNIDDLPLIFIRVRNPQQMKRISRVLGMHQRILTGYVFPKFTIETGKEYLEILEQNNSEGLTLYGMPILESSGIMYKESRMDTLLKIKELADSYQPHILNIRIGATDFCGLFGIRRNIDTTVYDISVIRDCVTDIINLFNRKEEGYVISGPVWEFFSKEPRILKPKLRMTPFQERYGSSGMHKRTELINQSIDGLINEVLLDKLNGIVGKTVIHPTHIKPVHAQYAVTHEEYMDAVSIMANSEGQAGVVKSQYDNKMNEMKPHYYWAKRIMLRSKAFGVYNEDQDFTSLIIESAERALQEVKL